MFSVLDEQLIRRLHGLSRAGAFLVLAFSLVALTGWFADLPALTSIKTGLARTSVATALCFAASAFALYRLTAWRQEGIDWPRQVAAGAVAAVALYVLLGYLAGQPDAGFVLGRALGQVSPATAFSFALLAVGVGIVDARAGWPASVLAALGLTIVALDLTGYAYGVDALYRVLPFSAMALPTALAFAVLFLAQMLARPEQGWVQYALRGHRYRMVLTLLLPAVIVVPFALGFATEEAVTRGLLAAPFGLAILSVGTMALLSALVLTVSACLAQSDEALRAAETELRQNGQLLETAMNVAQLGIWVSEIPPPGSEVGRVKWSARIYDIFAADPATFDGMRASIMAMVHPEDQARLTEVNQAVRQHDMPIRVSYRIVRPDGAVRWVQQQGQLLRDGRGEPLRVVGVLQDVTDQRAIEERLIQAQKMEAVGNLTGGMAHDVNNQLTVIIGNLDLLPERAMRDEETAESVGFALAAAQRAADLMHRLLAFARRQPLQPQRIVPNDLITGIVHLLSRTLGETVEISLDLAQDVAPILIDPAQLESSITNLANNARDAMPKGGRLTIRSANRHLDADYADSRADVRPGDYVMIEVSDNGAGMPPATAARVFEPFFTTKPPGEGTGLGLSMVFGFVKQSGGHIAVYSEPGVGTTFRLFLPQFDADRPDAPAPAEAPLRASGGNETVLVVEDNASVRRIVVRQIAELGYRVLEAASGAVALEFLEQDGVDVLFTDVVMPGELNGLELTRLATARQPGLRVILTSGFPEATISGRQDAIAGLRLLSKPYRRSDLARALQEALNNAP